MSTRSDAAGASVGDDLAGAFTRGVFAVEQTTTYEVEITLRVRVSAGAAIFEIGGSPESAEHAAVLVASEIMSDLQDVGIKQGEVLSTRGREIRAD